MTVGAVPVVVTASAGPWANAIARAEQKAFDPRPGTWRTFEVVTRVEVLNPRGTPRVWLPVPSVKTDYQNPGENRWSGNARAAKVVDDGAYGAGMLAEARVAHLVQRQHPRAGDGAGVDECLLEANPALASAWRRAPSSSTVRKAPIVPSTARIRSRCASTSSAALYSPSRKPRAASRAMRRVMGSLWVGMIMPRGGAAGSRRNRDR